MNPQHSLRKVFGVYEHELNGWISSALRSVTRVIDVGANDGYFTFGCAAVLRLRGFPAEIVAYEPDDSQFATLTQSVIAQHALTIKFTLIQGFVGAPDLENISTLDGLSWTTCEPKLRESTLIKIDVEGAEEEVLAGAKTWLNASNRFLIEVHKEEYLRSITTLFADHGLTLRRINQSPLPIIGRELRNHENCWLVSDLS